MALDDFSGSSENFVDYMAQSPSLQSTDKTSILETLFNVHPAAFTRLITENTFALFINGRNNKALQLLFRAAASANAALPAREAAVASLPKLFEAGLQPSFIVFMSKAQMNIAAEGLAATGPAGGDCVLEEVCEKLSPRPVRSHRWLHMQM